MIVIRQFAQYIGWYVSFSIFIVGIGDLRALQIRCQLFLLYVSVFPQFTQSVIH